MLDNLSAAAEARDLPHEPFLPVTADDCDEVAQLRTALARVRDAVGSVGRQRVAWVRRQLLEYADGEGSDSCC